MTENKKKEIRPIRLLKNNLPLEPKKVRVISRRERLDRMYRTLKTLTAEVKFERDAEPN